MAIANTAGRIPRRMSAAHHAAASAGSALGRTLKNFHSLRWVIDQGTLDRGHSMRSFRVTKIGASG